MSASSLKRKLKLNLSSDRARKRLKFSSPQNSTSVHTVHPPDYGSNIAEIEVDGNELQLAVQDRISHLRISQQEAEHIEAETCKQFKDCSERYTAEWMFRLTASKFGAVFRRQMSTPCHALVKEVLQQNSNLRTAVDMNRWQ